MQQVLVLNASYEPLNVTSVRRAHVLVFKGKAEVIEELDRPLHSATDTYPWPHVIRLVAYVRVPRAVQRKISRRALFARDGWRCVYCGTTAGRLTLDHVIPAIPWRRIHLGERRHRVRAVQPPEGQPHARRGAHGARPSAEGAGAGAVHSSCRTEDPERLAAVPRPLRQRHGNFYGRARVALDRQVELLPLAPRAGVELSLASREVKRCKRTVAVTPDPQ